MPKIIDPAQALREFVAQYPTQKEAAKALQISNAYMTDLLRGQRTFSAVILERLGLEWVVTKAG